MASIVDEVASSTIGAAWRGWYGTVDPWTLDALKQNEGDARVKASGPVSADRAAQIRGQVANEIDAQLFSQNAHPSQSSSFLDTLSRLFSVPDLKTAKDFMGYLTLGLILVAVGYFLLVYRAPISRAGASVIRGAKWIRA